MARATSHRAFTLVEMLVVVTIITILVSMLVPSMELAFESARQARCLSNQRTMGMALHDYARNFQSRFPDYPVIDNAATDRSAYDLRFRWSPADQARVPGGLGRLPTGNYLPQTQLGAVLHCPSLNNWRAPMLNTFDVAGTGMDQPWIPRSGTGWWGAGGSYWLDPAFARKRIISSYNWRGASWMNLNKTNMKVTDMGSGDVVLVDVADTNWARRAGEPGYHHPDAYNRAFGDLSAALFRDPERKVPALIQAYVSSRGFFDGWSNAAGEENVIYPHLATQK